MKSPSFKALQIPKFNVVLTTYQILVSDFKHLSSIPWKCIIIDEGQRLKCSDSKLFKYALTLVAEHRILLSGTPLQNNIGELFNLLEYLDPVKFSAETRESFAKMFAESVMLQNHDKIF
jgi:SNF2 family DNA or RNA helicase